MNSDEYQPLAFDMKHSLPIHTHHDIGTPTDALARDYAKLPTYVYTCGWTTYIPHDSISYLGGGHPFAAAYATTT